MQLTGVEVPPESLKHIEPNTIMVAISDKDGAVRVVKLDYSSIPKNESFIRVTGGTAEEKGGCWVAIGGSLIWINPCPH